MAPSESEGQIAPNRERQVSFEVGPAVECPFVPEPAVELDLDPEPDVGDVAVVGATAPR
ncbi:MAG: hypothetical protein ACR2K3_04530 [Nocardioides sp.]